MNIIKKLTGGSKEDKVDNTESTTTGTGTGIADSNPTAPAGLNEQSTSTTTAGGDPFAGQRNGGANPSSTGTENGGTTGGVSFNENTTGERTSPVADRRLSSDEWDASKTPPSRFQQRKGSVYATPASRDGHVEKNVNRDAAFHELHDKKHGKGKRRGSTAV